MLTKTPSEGNSDRHLLFSNPSQGNHNHQGNGNDAIFIDCDLPIENMLFPCVEPWSQDWSRRNEFLKQATQAFSIKPSLNGVIHCRRKIKLGKRGFRCNYFPSRKNATGSLGSVYIPMESRLETAHAVQLERKPNVRAYRTQAIELDVYGNRVFPDFLIVNHSGQLYVDEVKADKRYLSSKMKQRIDHLTEMLGRWGINYAVVDSFDLPQGTKLENLLWLNQRINVNPTECQIKAFLELDFDKSTYGQLRILCKSKQLDESLVTYLIFIEGLNIDWLKPIDDESEVWR